MNTEVLEMPTELFSQLGTNEMFTREVNFAHGVCNTGGHLLHYCTMYEGKRYITTKEQKEQAAKFYEINKQKAIENVGNKLVFVGMGMDYNARYEDDVCNHRIRTEILNPDGRRFFIEVGTWGNELMRIDHVIDRDQEDEYTNEAQRLRKIINDSKMLFQRHPLFEAYQKAQGQPYHLYKKDAWFDLRTKYTNANVLALVNSLFDCHFTEMVVDYCHLTTEVYTSKSPVLETA